MIALQHRGQEEKLVVAQRKASTLSETEAGPGLHYGFSRSRSMKSVNEFGKAGHCNRQ
jgi:hypothetical protein